MDAKPDAVAFYSALGFKPFDLLSGTLGDRPEPVAMFLPMGQIAAAVKAATDRTKSVRRYCGAPGVP